MKTKLLMMAATALMLAGCSNDENEVTNSWNGEIRLSSGVTVQTRADTPTPPDTQIANGQEVGVFINEASTENQVIGANLKYNADGQGGLELATTDPEQEKPYYPTSGNMVTIVAYHPYNVSAPLKGPYDFTVAENQSDNKNYYNSDLLYSQSKQYARQPEAHSLSFKHQLSKVFCTLKSGAGKPNIEGAIVSIVYADTKGSFNPADGTFTTLKEQDNKKDITMNSTITPNSYIAIVPPQDFKKDAKFLKVQLSQEAGGGTFYYSIPNETGDKDLILEPGHIYKYEISVNFTGLEVTSSIEGWEGISDGPTPGDAVME